MRLLLNQPGKETLVDHDGTNRKDDAQGSRVMRQLYYLERVSCTTLMGAVSGVCLIECMMGLLRCIMI